MNITFERKMDEFTKVEYGFYLYDDRQTLYLDVYRVWKKESHKHKFRIIKQYCRLRLDHRSSWRPDNVELKDIQLTDDIKNEALDKLRSMIKVDKWKDAG